MSVDRLIEAMLDLAARLDLDHTVRTTVDTAIDSIDAEYAEEILGALRLAGQTGGAEFTADHEVVIRALAVAAGALIGNARLHEQLWSDRTRIASALHDEVIPRLFAVGLSLQSTLRRAEDPELRAWLTDTMQEVETVTRDVRYSIHELHNKTRMRAPSLRERLHQAVAEETAESGLRAIVRLVGPISVLAPPLSDEVEAVLRDAVRDVVRHGSATRVSIGVRVRDEVAIEIADDAGTVLRWSAPLP